MKLIVGLGNPGSRYRFTRHNIGFLIAHNLADENNIPLFTRDSYCLTGEGFLFGHPALIATPMTYMNKSGEAVSALVEKYHISLENILVAHDDMDIPLGKIKLKTSGGSAGHQGVESIIQNLNTDAFLRIRFGIGKPTLPYDPSHFVLEEFSPDEHLLLKVLLKKVNDCIEMLIHDGPAAAMNRYHGR